MAGARTPGRSRSSQAWEEGAARHGSRRRAGASAGRLGRDGEGAHARVDPDHRHDGVRIRAGRATPACRRRPTTAGRSDHRASAGSTADITKAWPCGSTTTGTAMVLPASVSSPVRAPGSGGGVAGQLLHGRHRVGRDRRRCGCRRRRHRPRRAPRPRRPTGSTGRESGGPSRRRRRERRHLGRRSRRRARRRRRAPREDRRPTSGGGRRCRGLSRGGAPRWRRPRSATWAMIESSRPLGAVASDAAASANRSDAAVSRSTSARAAGSVASRRSTRRRSTSSTASST